MTETKNNCPICGKVGIPEFRKKEVVCPACNTNLNAYMLLNQLESKGQGKRMSKILLFVIPCSLFIFSMFYIFKQRNIQKEVQLSYSQEVVRLKEEIASSKEKGVETVEVVIFFEYTVKKGDSFYLISKKIYGTEKYAKDIAYTNQMDFTSKLTIGYKLLIPQR
jgi:LysM repeat protein